jgi:site-specific recombinase XerD
MSALPQAAHTPSPWWSTIEFPWTETAARAPVMVATMAAYLDQLGVSARHATVAAAEQQLRHFAGQVTEADPECTSMAAVERRHIEAHKLWLAARPGKAGKPLAAVTIRNRLGTLRTFFERLRDWDYDDAPSRTLIFPGDFPQADEPLPKFLDDPTMEKFKVALANDPNPRRRLMVEILTQTGIRAGELAGLQDDAVTTLGDSISLRIPVGKLHNDRYVPLLPPLVDLIASYQKLRGPSRSGLLLERDDGQPFDRRTIHRYVDRVAKRAGVGHVHPHQLRHTMATQFINQGMSLEVIAALLGHRSMRMTLTYARISSRTVAEEYFRVTQAIEANYEKGEPLPASLEGTNMRRIAAEHRRLLGNGHCTRPRGLDCTFESVCERCGFFETGPQFVTILRRQRDDAVGYGQDDRAELLDGFLKEIDEVG